MPIDYKKYHPQWDLIRAKVLKRADNRCEVCKVKNHELILRGFSDGVEIYQDMDGTIWRTSDGSRFGDAYLGDIGSARSVKIVLTISHQDHDINNNDYSNLKALCQLHHLRHDKEHHARTRKSKSKQIKLF